MQNLHALCVTSKRRKWVMMLVGILVFVTVFILLRDRGEGPIYKGRHLSKWVEVQGRLFGDSVSWEERLDSEDALAAVGTNAFPFLLRWIQHEDKYYRYKLFSPLGAHIPQRRFVDLTTSPAVARADGAAEALQKLSTNFTSGEISELTRLANNANAPQTAERATRALAFAGPEGFRELAALLQNPHHSNRHSAYLRVLEMNMNNRLSPDARIFVPGLIQYVTNTNAPAVIAAGWLVYARTILSNLNVVPEAYVPTLMTNLHNPDADVRRCAVITLPRFGADAAPAAPALTSLLSDPDAGVRTAATNALRQIAPEVLTNAPTQ